MNQKIAMKKNFIIHPNLKLQTIIRCLNPLLKIHAPLGDQWVDYWVKELGLDKSNGRWKNSAYSKSENWDIFLSQIQQSYTYRRNLSQDISEKRKWNQLLLEFEINHQMVIVKGYPRRAYVEITKDCNLRCPMCPQGYEDLNRSSLPVSSIRFLEPCLPYLELVELFGFGDPLVATNFEEWIKYWPRIEGQTVTMTTNGLLLNQDKIQSILNSSLNQIRISIDGITPEIYQKMRGINGLSRLLENIQLLVNERDSRKSHLAIWAKITVSQINIHELLDMVKWMHKLGVDYMEVMFLCSYTPDQWSQSLVYDRELCNRMFDKAKHIARKLKFPLRLPDLFDISISPSNMDKGEFQGHCREPWEYFYMTNEMKSRPCCINMTELGDFQYQNFEEIWNGISYQDFRKKLVSRHKQYRCRYCYVNYLYADVNNIRSHLIDLKPHYDEIGLGDKIHLPESADLENVIKIFCKNKEIPSPLKDNSAGDYENQTEFYWDRYKNIFPITEGFLSHLDTEYPDGIFPRFISNGRDGHLTDIDGKSYIDYTMGFGSVLLGYCYPEVYRAIIKQATKPIHSTIMSPLQIEVAELLREFIPSAEMVIFGKNGSDVCTAAIRLARMVTGRQKILSYGYHGYHDWYIALEPGTHGISPELRNHILPLRYNSLEQVNQYFQEYPDEIAAVIMDPFTRELPVDNYLKKLEEITHRHGAILIFDEIITGFRVSLGGAQEYYGVKPELTCLSKSIANGMPLSALIGKREILKDISKTKYSLTYYYETLSLAAAKVSLIEIQKNRVWEDVYEKGKYLMDSYNQIAGEMGLSTKLVGFPSRLFTEFGIMNNIPEIKLHTLLLQELAKEGILTNTCIYPCYRHTGEDLEKTIQSFEKVLQKIRIAIDKDRIESMLDVQILRESHLNEPSKHPPYFTAPWHEFSDAWREIIEKLSLS